MGESKLDKALTSIVEAIMTMLAWALIIGIPVVILEQICIALTNYMENQDGSI